jgi:hypothetical protein
LSLAFKSWDTRYAGLIVSLRPQVSIQVHFMRSVRFHRAA